MRSEIWVHLVVHSADVTRAGTTLRRALSGGSHVVVGTGDKPLEAGDCWEIIARVDVPAEPGPEALCGTQSRWLRRIVDEFESSLPGALDTLRVCLDCTDDASWFKDDGGHDVGG